MRDRTPIDDCLLDALIPSTSGDSGSSHRFQATSLAFACEAVLISALAIWPLFNASHLPRSIEIARIPSPLNFAPPGASARMTATHSSAPARAPIFTPPRIPATIFRGSMHATPNPAPPLSQNIGIGTPTGFSSGALGNLGTAPLTIRPPEPARPRVRVIRRSERVEEGQLVRRVLPVYPPIARIARISGFVELLVLVGRDGRVKLIQVLSGNPVLAASAKAGVEQWRYRPAFVDGQPAEVETRVTVHFVLDE